MTILQIISAAGLIIFVGLAGCSSGDHDMAKPSHMSSAGYSASGNGYMGTTSIGQVMTTPDGMTVYTFDKDQPGMSSCYDECAEHWPPVTAASDAQPFGNMTVIERNDGTRQWAYSGMPLYTYDDDDAPGDVEGDNEHGVWHVVR